ncbi:hypothetical protein KAK06_03230 [Ideonella sp. 4Y11]|uniref:Ketosynthase family 3 (KS3) domain-containing protein n=2 Tax=Ideonella aquatica TaxID=2824119 RepID=A0A940YD18_9BURK|nr:hypothetical protein [Ideonella aquatica]
MATDDGTVVLTGVGAIGPFGAGVEALWSSLLEGHCLLQPDTEWPAAGLAGRVPQAAAPQPAPDAGDSRRSVSALAFAAAEEAIAQAGLDAPQVDRAGVAVLFATACGSSGVDVAQALEQAFRSARFEMPDMKAMSDTLRGPSSVISHAHGYRGPLMNLPNGWCAGLSALAVACDLLRFGLAPAVVLAAADETGHDRPSGTRPMARRMGLLSPDDGAQTAVRPFDRRANGTAWSEGGAALVLETLTHARARGAVPLAWVAGNGLAAGDIGDGALVGYDEQAMAEALGGALAQAGHPRVQAVYAGSHCSERSEAAEARALHRCLATQPMPAVTNVRGALGEAGAATGLFSLIAATRSLHEDRLPGTTGCQQLRDGLALPVSEAAQTLPGRGAILCAAHGHDGHSASALLRHAEEIPA